MITEATLVVIKPDAIRRGLVGMIITRLEHLRLEVIAVKAMRVSRELAEEHYRHLREKPFFQELLQHLCGELHEVDYVLAMIYVGPGAIGKVREVTGATHPEKADPLSIRGSIGRMTTQGWMENLLHASSDAAEAEREIKLWFSPAELLKPVYPTKSAPGNGGALVTWA